MRSKLSTFVAIALVAMLCTVVFAKVGSLVSDQANMLATKHGVSLTTAPESVAPAAPLPPVGPRNGNPLDEIIISEDFESYAFGTLPPGWTQIDVDGGTSPVVSGPSQWQVFGGQGYPGHGGTKSVANFYNSPADPNNDWLILPQQNLSGTITLSYWVSSQDPDYLESYEVRVSTTGNQPANFTNLVGDFNDTPNAWTQRTHDLSAFAGAPFWIAFHYDATDEFVIKIDDLLLEGVQEGDFGTITGVVTDDNTNDPIASANVELVGGATTTTNASGIFWFNNVNAGNYSLVFSAALYESDTVAGVTVVAAETTHVDVGLHHMNVDIYDFQSSAPHAPIRDLDSAYMDLTVDEDHIIVDLDVTINIAHTYDSDITIWLQTPWQDRVILADGNGGSGDNFVNTRFDDEAATPIGSGAAPFTGSFRPIEPLTIADASSSIGTWTLIVYDAFAADTGHITDFTLHVTAALAADDPQVSVPSSFVFHGNYPNPFNATTQFTFDMTRAGHASLVLYNITGQEVARLVDGDLQAGHHLIAYNAASLPSGLYFARFDAPGYSATAKTILLK